MITTITIRDEATFGQVLNEFVLEITAETLTVQELIERRVQSEVAKYNTQLPEYFSGLVRPKEAERTLNGYRYQLRKRKPIDWKQQAAVAVEMFQTNGFILIINDQQVDSLDSLVELTAKTTISFLKLTPLVGG